MFMSKKIAIIGGGNLGASIAEGLIQSEFSRPVELSITRRNLSTLGRFAEQGSMVHSDNRKAVKTAEIIILAVKPYNFSDIINEIRTVLDPKKHVLVSVITGVWIDQIQKAIGKPEPVIRAMPNTAIAIQQSMTCLAHAGASTSQINYIRQLFDQLGRTAMTHSNRHHTSREDETDNEMPGAGGRDEARTAVRRGGGRETVRKRRGGRGGGRPVSMLASKVMTRRFGGVGGVRGRRVDVTP